MLTLVLYALLAIAVATAVFFVVASLLPAGEQIAPSIRDDRPWELPADGTIHAEQVASVRLPVALRGYRFAETDVLLDRLAEELRARDELIAKLQGSDPVDAADDAGVEPETATDAGVAPEPSEAEPETATDAGVAPRPSQAEAAQAEAEQAGGKPTDETADDDAEPHAG